MHDSSHKVKPLTSLIFLLDSAQNQGYIEFLCPTKALPPLETASSRRLKHHNLHLDHVEACHVSGDLGLVNGEEPPKAHPSAIQGDVDVGCRSLAGRRAHLVVPSRQRLPVGEDLRAEKRTRVSALLESKAASEQGLWIQVIATYTVRVSLHLLLELKTASKSKAKDTFQRRF